MKEEKINSKVLYEGEIQITYIFSTNNGLESKRTTIPFSFNQDFPGVCNQSSIETKIELQNQEFIVSTDENIDAKIDIMFTTYLIKNTNINVIDDISEEESKNKDTSSLVIYFVKNGDTLWKIAKKFSSTVSEIERVNGIQNENELQYGKQIFIPRYNG